MTVQASQPVVSVIIPSIRLNSAHFNECLNSIFRQSFQEWEVIVVDDSENKKKTIPLHFGPRVRVFPNERKKGPSGARNYGLSLAKGEFIIFFDDDDEMSPDMLRELVQQASRYNNKTAVVCPYQNFETIDELRVYDFPIHLEKTWKLEEAVHGILGLRGTPFTLCNCLFRKSELPKNPWDEGLYGSGDKDFFLSLFVLDWEFIGISSGKFFYRKHDSFRVSNQSHVDLHRATSNARMIVKWVDYLGSDERWTDALITALLNIQENVVYYQINFPLEDIQSRINLLEPKATIRPIFRLRKGRLVRALLIEVIGLVGTLKLIARLKSIRQLLN